MKPQLTVRKTGDEGAQGVEKAKRLTAALVTVIDKGLQAEADREAARLEQLNSRRAKRRA